MELYSCNTSLSVIAYLLQRTIWPIGGSYFLLKKVTSVGPRTIVGS